MATTLSTPAEVTTVEADPTKPWKAIVAVLIPIAITVVQLVQSSLNDGSWTNEDTLNVVLAVLGALAVYLVPNPIVKADRANGLANGL